MKFSRMLRFNSVPDWTDYYIAYSNLKKLIYRVERKFGSTLARVDVEAPSELTSLLNNAKSRANAVFIPALDKEVEKITSFYRSKEYELFEYFETLLAEVAYLESLEGTPALRMPAEILEARSKDRRLLIRRNSAPFLRRQRTASDADRSIPSSDDDEDLDALDDDMIYGISDEQGNSYFWANPAVEADRIGFKRQIIELFVRFSELKSYVSLNHTGFSKILKKYDKVVPSDPLKPNYLDHVVGESYPFTQPVRDKLNEKVKQIEELYAKICTNNDVDLATAQLKMYLRESIVWEQNTIWRDMIALERRTHAVGINTTTLIEPTATTELKTPFGNFTVHPTYRTTTISLVLCVATFISLINSDFFNTVEERNCFALLVFASLLWATEVVPLFVTSLLIPLLVVVLRVMRSDDYNKERLSAYDATRAVFSAMFSPVIMLLLGGFAIAAALSKYHIAKTMATFVLAKAGTKPSRVLFANMIVATVASMWISNVAAPVLCFSLIQPILRNLPQNSSFGRCLILGIALASNVGGMASPISSPQNIIAIKNMNPAPSWIEWFVVAIPLCIIIDIIIWLILLWSYEPSKNSLTIHPIRTSREPWTGTQVFVMFVTVSTIMLWCAEKPLEEYVGDMGVIAILPLLFFFGTGILSKEDFNNFLWTVIILAMGGIALGKAVYSSGLLHTIAHDIKGVVAGLSVWEVMVVFSILVLVVATFISHTVAALIILPIVAQVGNSLLGGHTHQNLLVMGCALTCSAAMGLPVSGFPNMNAIMMEDKMGVRYLSTKDFLKNGIISSLFAMLAVITIGYLVMFYVLTY